MFIQTPEEQRAYDLRQAEAARANQFAGGLAPAAQWQGQQLVPAPRGNGKGKGKVQWGKGRAGQKSALFQLPHWSRRLSVMQDDSALSSILLDTRDGRMISPWQGHYALEIADNADTHVNVVTERAQMLTASNGYLMSLFGIYTFQQFKLVISVSMDSATAVPCGAWDGDAARALLHDGFQPFDWPRMVNDSPTNVDVEIKIHGELLAHWHFRSYRSDRDM
jgi:hypothetical protein